MIGEKICKCKSNAICVEDVKCNSLLNIGQFKYYWVEVIKYTCIQLTAYNATATATTFYCITCNKLIQINKTRYNTKKQNTTQHSATKHSRGLSQIRYDILISVSQT
jgi:hypothetical protein